MHGVLNLGNASLVPASEKGCLGVKHSPPEASPPPSILSEVCNSPGWELPSGGSGEAWVVAREKVREAQGSGIL